MSYYNYNPFKVGQKSYNAYVPEEVQAVLADHPAIVLTYGNAYVIRRWYSEADTDADRAEVVAQVAAALDDVDEILRQTDEVWQDATPRWQHPRLARMDLGSTYFEETFGGITIRGSGWQTEHGDVNGFQPSLRIRFHAWGYDDTQQPVPLSVRLADKRPGILYKPDIGPCWHYLYETMITPLMAEWNEPIIENSWYDYWFDRWFEHIHDDNRGWGQYYELWTPAELFQDWLLKIELYLNRFPGGDLTPYYLDVSTSNFLPSRDWLMDAFNIGYVANRTPYEHTWY